MELSYDLTEHLVVVSIVGEIDAITGPDLEQYLKELLIERKNFVVDFSKVDFISSAGLRVLLTMVKETRRVGGDIRLSAIKENVFKVLKISGFSGILKVYPNTKEASESYSA
jgi:anti-anti-sigma factor